MIVACMLTCADLHYFCSSSVSMYLYIYVECYIHNNAYIVTNVIPLLFVISNIDTPHHTHRGAIRQDSDRIQCDGIQAQPHALRESLQSRQIPHLTASGQHGCLSACLSDWWVVFLFIDFYHEFYFIDILICVHWKLFLSFLSLFFSSSPLPHF